MGWKMLVSKSWHFPSHFKPKTEVIQQLCVYCTEVRLGLYVGTCESAVCVRIESRIESGIKIRIRIEYRIESAVGPMIVISILLIQLVKNRRLHLLHLYIMLQFGVTLPWQNFTEIFGVRRFWVIYYSLLWNTRA